MPIGLHRLVSVCAEDEFLCSVLAIHWITWFHN